MTDPIDSNALEVQHLSHRYGDHLALDDLNLVVASGNIFALLGPNGSGKTTLFRLVSTIARVQSGDLRVFGHSPKTDLGAVRSSIGIVFQAPSLDRKLTVLENIRCQAALYGLSGASLKSRIDEVVERLGIADRLTTIVEKLSGGLKRRVELAKGILHRPRLLLLDEPSTGLDPAARLDLWHALEQLRAEYGVTVLLTTHLLEEADKADRIAILHQGRSVAVGSPTQLRSELGAQVLSIQTNDQPAVLAWLESRSITSQQFDNQLRIAGSSAAELVAPLAQDFGTRIQSLTLSQPSLEDVFVAKTGHVYW
jgi:ABC-2 type transport system ATP-binding protein